MSTTLANTDAGTAALSAARMLAPEISARAPEGEDLGTLPLDLVAKIRSAGLFRIIQPRALGGMELDPATVIEVFSEICRADGSTGWTTLIGAGGAGFAAWLDPAVAVDLFGADADYTSATVFAPTGQARPDGAGGFDVSGRWPFASGCRHAEWLLNGVFVFEGDAPRMVPDRGPDWRLAYLPAASVEIIDNWDVIGLRGTGSNDIAAQNVRVAEEHTISPFFEPARHDGPLWRLSFFTLAGIAVVALPLGIGRRALDELAALAPTKTRAGSFEPLAQDAAVQVDLARVEGGMQAAHAFVLDAVGSLWDTAVLGDEPSIEQRARFQLSAQNAMRAAKEAVDLSFAIAGAGAIHRSHPLQRCFRDLHTGAQHAYFSSAALKRYAKVRLGIEQPTFMM